METYFQKKMRPGFFAKNTLCPNQEQYNKYDQTTKSWVMI